MKSIWIAGVMSLTLAGIVAPGQRNTAGRGAVQPAPESGPGSILGIVRRPDTMEPIGNVTVTLFTGPDARPGRSTAITDTNGRFKFADVALGTYNIQASRAGYFIDGVVTGRTPVQPTVARTATAVHANQTTASVVLELIPGGIVTGRIYDPGGQLMAGVQVAPLPEGYQDGHRALFTTSGSVISDDRGEFRISGLAPGQYFVRATPRAANQTSVTMAYYPSGLDARDAQPVTVKAGRESPADIRIPSDPPIKITGRIVAQDPTALLGGSPVPYSLMPRDAALWDMGLPVIRTNPRDRGFFRNGNGEFELQVSRGPGLYELIATVVLEVDAAGGGFGAATRYLAGRIPIDLRGKDIEGLAVPLLPTVDLQVRLVGNGDAALARQISSTQLNLGSREPLPISLAPRNATAAFASAANPSNETRFSPITEGRYFLDSALAQLTDAYVADIRQGGKSLYEDGTIVVGKGQPEPVDVILARTAGTIEGVVQDATGKAVAGSQVILVPNGKRRENPLFYKNATSAADGQFTLRGLAPGQYKVFAWESIPLGAERNAQFMERFEGFGRAISVRTGSSAVNVIVPVIRRAP